MSYKLYGLDLVEYDYCIASGKEQAFSKAYTLNQSSLFFVTNYEDTFRIFQFVTLYISSVSIRTIHLETNHDYYFGDLIFENGNLISTKLTHYYFNDAKPFYSLKDAIKYKTKLELLK